MRRRFALVLLGALIAGTAGASPALASPVVTSPEPRPIDDSCPHPFVPEDGFADVGEGGAHESAVDCVVHWKIAHGFSPTSYRPDAPVKRAQMASFIARLIDVTGARLPATDVDHFADDGASAHRGNIDRLAAVGIVGGRGPGVFDPEAGVTRAQMTAFLTRAYDYLARQHGAPALTAGQDAFGDDTGNVLEPAINTAAGAGFAGGYGDRVFGPAGLVRRDQMASFLARVLDLAVEEGMAVVPGTAAPAASGPSPASSPTASPSPSAPPSSSPTPSPSATRSPSVRPSPSASPSASPAASPSTAPSESPAPEEPEQPPGPGNSRNCGDFGSWREAQDWFDLYYPEYGDVANLDPDGDRIACGHLHDAPGSVTERAAGGPQVDVVQVYWTQPDTRPLSEIVDVIAASDAHLNELTRGNVDLVVGKTTEWVEIPAPTKPCEPYEIMRSAQTAGKFTPGPGRHLVVYFPHDDGCHGRGFGEQPGSGIWLNGSVDVSVVVHELMHNFGARHADAVYCQEPSGAHAVQGPNTSCSVLDAGDPYDLMGHNHLLRDDLNRFSTFGLPNLLDLGVVEQADVPEVGVGADQVFTLNRSSSGSGLRGLRITQDTRRYVVEYRAEPASDERPADDGEGGVLVRLDDPALRGYDGGMALMDFQPNQWNDGKRIGNFALLPGRAWRAPDGAFSIQTLAVDSDTATVRLTVRPTG